MASDVGFVEICGREENTRVYFESMEPIIEIHASSIHTLDFDVLLSELRDIVNNDEIDKSFLYDEEGKIVFQAHQLFMMCCKQ